MASGRRAIFHRWIKLGPSCDGYGDTIYGIVEYEDGSVGKHRLGEIRFIDNRINFDDYDWGDDDVKSAGPRQK